VAQVNCDNFEGVTEFHKTEVEQFLVIYESNLQVIEKSDPPNNIDWEVFRFGEVDR